MNFEFENNRLLSFYDEDGLCIWVHQFRPLLRTKYMALAGFFYTGISDRVKCFCCGGVLAVWTITDNPLVEHIIKYPDCSFIKRKFNEILLKKDDDDDNNNDNGIICKICYKYTATVVVLPCSHLGLCHKCYDKINNKCPFCITPIDSIIKINTP